MTGELNSLCEAFQRTAASNTGPALINAQTGHTVTWEEYARPRAADRGRACTRAA